jgi:hypothetical protein
MNIVKVIQLDKWEKWMMCTTIWKPISCFSGPHDFGPLHISLNSKEHAFIQTSLKIKAGRAIKRNHDSITYQWTSCQHHHKPQHHCKPQYHCKPHQSPNGLPLVIHLAKHPSITQWLLALQLSQSYLSGHVTGSNASTVISVLSAFNLSWEAVFPETTTEITKVACYFHKIMMKGNHSYANLEVKDVLIRFPGLN